jgi:hypothetical protein
MTLELNQQEKEAAAKTVNSFSLGGHPPATASNIGSFNPDFVRRMVKAGIKRGIHKHEATFKSLAEKAGCL